MGSFAAAIYCFIGLLSFVRSANSQPALWQLNTSYTVSQPELTQENGAPWPLDQYPGSLASIVMGQTFADVSIYLCLLSSPSPTPSMQNLSSTLSIYMSSDLHYYYGGAIVWTANRLQAISASKISVWLRADGNLVLLAGDDLRAEPIWSSNTANRGVTTMEIAQHPARLILRGATGDAVWKSTDYPTDTMTADQYLLPGQSLTSWASATDPSPGAYRLVMEPGGLALYMGLQNPEPYWIWGFYGINDLLSVTRTCKKSLLAVLLAGESFLYMMSIFPGSPVPVNSSYYWPPFCASQYNYSIFPSDKDVTDFLFSNSTFLQLQHDGSLRIYSLGTVWSVQLDILNGDPCLLPEYCGPYAVCSSGSQCTCASDESFFHPIDISNFSSGCALKSELLCNDQSLKKQTMLQLSGVDYVGNSYTPSLNISSMEACVNGCAQNCSCLAAFWRRDVNACHHIDEVRSLRGSLNQSIYLAYVKVNKLPPNGQKRAIIVKTTVPTAVLLCILILLLVRYRRHKRVVEDDDEDDDAFLGATEGFPTRYTYKDLQQITNDFEKQLGKGGFGAVYVGKLADGTTVAVKRLESLKQGFKEFAAEVKIMAGISHQNLLRLRGFCAQKGHKLLVYDYMENGSLDQWLFSEAEKRAELTWSLRCSIALGIARGLAYLHHESRERVLHLDIKPQNILLDETFEAKVADFGLSRLISKSEIQVMTTMRGTPGYISPDWLTQGVIDEKSDVFSFGMMLMEIVGGRRNQDYSVEAKEKVYYPEWAFWQAQRADITVLTDSVLGDAEDEVQLRRMINTAFLCVLESPALRPSMRDVVLMLEGLVRVQDILLSDLHQGLLFVLRSPTCFATVRIDEALKSLMQPISDTDPLLRQNTYSVFVSAR